MYIRQFANVGKYLLKRITGLVDYIEAVDIELDKSALEEEVATNQLTLREKIELLALHAKKTSTDPLDELDAIIEKAMNDDFSNSVHKKTKWIYSTKHHRLSRTQILQMLFYHFLSVDEYGVIRDVCEKTIAKLLNCTIRTVRNNNILLEKIGLINHSRNGNGLLNIQIIDHKSTYLSKQNGGSGYFPISFERFKELLKIENVNALRLELRQEMVHDNKKGIEKKHNQTSSSARISLHDLKTFLPKYTHYTGKIQEFLGKGTGVFKSVIQNGYVYFELAKGVLTGKEWKEKKTKEYRDTFTALLKKNHGQGLLESFVFDDLVQLAFEYSLERVTSIVEKLFEQVFKFGEKNIENWGGTVRTLIRKQMTLEAEYASFEKIA